MMASGLLLSLLSFAPPYLATAKPLDVFYGPHQYVTGDSERFFELIKSPQRSWPTLAANTQYFKLFEHILYPTYSDHDLKGLISALEHQKIKTQIEIGGARWGKRCTVASMLQYAASEQERVSRWLELGGKVDSVVTDHAMTWDIRQDKPGSHCTPRVPMAVRIETLAQVLASWRSFLGPKASMGFIESLGFWEIAGLDGTNFTNTAPSTLDHIPGWMPRLDDVTRLLLEAAQKYNPLPSIPLIDHYQIDHELDGVEHDTARYGPGPSGGMNYERILGAEAIMQKHGLRSGIILNAKKGGGPTCLVSCEGAPNHTAALRTLNYTGGYLALSERLSDHAVLQQWMPFPNVTGPESLPDTSMWMASEAAKLIKAAATSPVSLV